MLVTSHSFGGKEPSERTLLRQIFESLPSECVGLPDKLKEKKEECEWEKRKRIGQPKNDEFFFNVTFYYVAKRVMFFLSA